ncbi:hypothetical protein AQJ66_32395 [Streptomyces bungoensis]|uniref:Uncharacterized protein n=1 Tax=Streptomyces bungoensis TaxID=285568 RepID=A0A101SPT5_9ACTN|nr:hypothetical protein AQJ66_32395 [Streptomyces bungoensis]
MGEPGLQAGNSDAVVELSGDLPTDSALHVGVHVLEQEANRLQDGVKPATEGQLRPVIGLLAGGGGRDRWGSVLRAQRATIRCPDGARRSGGRLDVLVHRYLAYGGWQRRSVVLGSVNLQVFLIRERTRISVET